MTLTVDKESKISFTNVYGKAALAAMQSYCEQNTIPLTFSYTIKDSFAQLNTEFSSNTTLWHVDAFIQQIKPHIINNSPPKLLIGIKFIENINEDNNRFDFLIKTWGTDQRIITENVEIQSELEKLNNMPINQDMLYEKAAEFVVKNNKATISALQREFNISYKEAASFIELLEKRGIISPLNSSGKREILACL